MGERVAILIGNRTFEPSSGLEPLKYPERDVIDLAAILRDRDIGRFDVVIPTIDQPSLQIKLAIEKMLKQNLGAFVLIFYSGHGRVSDSNRLYLAARDTQEDLLVATAVHFDDIIKMKENTGHSRVGIILDCCFAGLGQDAVKGSAEDQVKAIVSGKGIFFIGASSSIQHAKEDDSLAHGLLTAAIIDGLKGGKAARDNDGTIKVSDLFDYCRAFMSTRAKQIPVCLNKIDGADIVVSFLRPKLSDTDLEAIRAKLKLCRDHQLLFESDLKRLDFWFSKVPVPVAPKFSLEAGFIRYVRGELALPDLELFRDGIGDIGKSPAPENPDVIKTVRGELALSDLKPFRDGICNGGKAPPTKFPGVTKADNKIAELRFNPWIGGLIGVVTTLTPMSVMLFYVLQTGMRMSPSDKRTIYPIFAIQFLNALLVLIIWIKVSHVLYIAFLWGVILILNLLANYIIISSEPGLSLEWTRLIGSTLVETGIPALMSIGSLWLYRNRRRSASLPRPPVDSS